MVIFMYNLLLQSQKWPGGTLWQNCGWKSGVHSSFLGWHVWFRQRTHLRNADGWSSREADSQGGPGSPLGLRKSFVRLGNGSVQKKLKSKTGFKHGNKKWLLRQLVNLSLLPKLRFVLKLACGSLTYMYKYCVFDFPNLEAERVIVTN